MRAGHALVGCLVVSLSLLACGGGGGGGGSADAGDTSLPFDIDPGDLSVDGIGPDTTVPTDVPCTTAADCDAIAGQLPECATVTCDQAQGVCVLGVAPEGTGCDDGDPCTTGDVCGVAECAGTAKDCDDGDACTTDTCNAGTGACESAAVTCDDGDLCTVDACDPASGCTTAPRDCDDGDACTTDTCNVETGACENAAVTCDDGDLCTVDACDPATGCTTAPKDCDDGDACTADTCNVETGACENAAIPCDDGDACTTDACDPATGCTTTPIPCDDGDACTTDACDAATGCTTTPVSCDDSDACTTDTCDPATGCASTPVSCDDSDACTADTCDPATGCASTPVSCDDGDACTADTCDPATGCASTPVSCDDGDPCTDDLCDAATGCSNPPTDCDDGDVCNGPETCVAGVGCASAATSETFVEDFESGAEGWSTGTLADASTFWQLTDMTGGSAPVVFDSVAYGTPNDGDDGLEVSYLQSPSFDLSNGGVVSFRSFVSNENAGFYVSDGSEDLIALELGDAGLALAADATPPALVPGELLLDGYDMERFEVSYDGGETWTELLSPGDPRWSEQREWLTFEVRVAAGVATADTRFRFVYDTIDDCCGPDDVSGWFIDDFIVTTGDALVCDDGDACTADACDPVAGCTFELLGDTACDDADVCTQDACVPSLGCLNESLASQCDDGTECSGDVCDPVEGCTFVFEATALTDPFDAAGGWTTGSLVEGGPVSWAVQAVLGGSDQLPLPSSSWVNTNAYASLGFEESYLLSPSFDTRGGARVSFVTWSVNADYFDGDTGEGPPLPEEGDEQRLEISFDGGATWQDWFPGTLEWWDWMVPLVADFTLGAGEGSADTRFRFVYVTHGPAVGAVPVQGWVIDDFTVETPLLTPCDDGLPCTDNVCVPYEGCAFESTCDDGNACTDDFCATETTCPFGLLEGESCYEATAQPATWGAARAACEAKGGHLVSIGDAGENALVRLLADEACGLGAELFIGVTDELVEGSFGWLDGSPLDYTNWSAGQPDDFGAGEDYGQMWPDGSWNDLPGDFALGCFVCEVAVAAAGTCAATPTVCADGLLCTMDACDPEAGCVFDQPAFDCDDDNPCTEDSCNGATGSCVHVSACGGGACDPTTGACLACEERLVSFDGPPLVDPSPEPGTCLGIPSPTTLQGVTFEGSGPLSACLAGEPLIGGIQKLYLGTFQLEGDTVTLTFPEPAAAISFVARDFLNYATTIGPWTIDVTWDGGATAFEVPTTFPPYVLVTLPLESEVTQITFSTQDVSSDPGTGVSFGLDDLRWTPGGDCPGSLCGNGACGPGESCLTCPGDCGPCDAGDCCGERSSPGCSNPAIEACVCAADAFCCENAWDGICANEGTALCGFQCGAICGDGDCALDGGEGCGTCPKDCGTCP